MKLKNTDGRRQIARELRTMLCVRRTVMRMRRTVTRLNRMDMIRTPLGPIPRQVLLNMVEKAFAEAVKRVCRARRTHFSGAARDVRA